MLLGESRTVSAKGSACMINSRAERESPCLTPRFTGKKRDIRPFVSVALFASLHNIVIHLMKLFSNPNASRILNNHVNSTLSKVLSWSSSSMQLFSSASFSIKSSSIRTQSELFRPGMHPLWSSWIISSITDLSLFDKILVIILLSLLRREIGLQFLISSLTPFYIYIIEIL